MSNHSSASKTTSSTKSRRVGSKTLSSFASSTASPVIAEIVAALVLPRAADPEAAVQIVVAVLKVAVDGAPSAPHSKREAKAADVKVDAAAADVAVTAVAQIRAPGGNRVRLAARANHRNNIAIVNWDAIAEAKVIRDSRVKAAIKAAINARV